MIHDKGSDEGVTQDGNRTGVAGVGTVSGALHEPQTAVHGGDDAVLAQRGKGACLQLFQCRGGWRGWGRAQTGTSGSRRGGTTEAAVELVVVGVVGEGFGGDFKGEAAFFEGLDDLCFGAVGHDYVVGEVG